MLGGLGARTRAILVLRECIRNAPTVSFILPAFDDTGSLGCSPRQVFYPPDSGVPPWVTGLRFHEAKREAELKPTNFFLMLIFRVFLAFLFP